MSRRPQSKLSQRAREYVLDLWTTGANVPSIVLAVEANLREIVTPNQIRNAIQKARFRRDPRATKLRTRAVYGR